MAFEVFDDYDQGCIMVVSLVALPICTLAVLLRFNASRQASQKTGLEDYFALGALAAFITYVSMVLTIIFMLNGKNFAALTVTQLKLAAKLVYADSPFYWTNQFFAKLSILLLYRRIFAIRKLNRWAIYTVALIHILFSIAVVLVAIFGCHPIAKGWDLTQVGTCVTTAPAPFLAGAESVNSSVDFAMVIMAVFMIRELNIGTTNKIKVSVLFALGGLAGIIGFVKIGQFYATGGGSKSRSVNLTIGLWTIIQQGCSIICCCAPIYKSLFPSSAGFHRLASKITGTWTRGSKSGRGSHPSQPTADKSSFQRNADSRGGTSGHSERDQHAWELLGDSQRRQELPEAHYPMKDLHRQHGDDVV